MLETMMALKNNDVRKIPGYDPEPLEKMKKLQRALVGPPVEQQRALVGPPVEQQRALVGPPVEQQRALVGPPVEQQRALVGPPVEQQRALVGAHFLETVVRRFDAEYRGGGGEGEGKEADNLLLVLCHLYSLQVVHCLLPFDLLRRLVAAFGERDLQLVLLVLRTVGMALRKDDAHALKELISEAQRKASEMGSKVADRTRVRFMLETMMALKNNDVRKIPGYDPEPLEKMKKLQRALVGPPVEQQRALVGPPVEQQRALVGPPVEQQRVLVGPPVEQQRALVGPPVEQQRALVGPPVEQQRVLVGPPVEQQRALVGPPVEQQRALTQGSRGGSDLTLRVSLDNVLAADQVGRWWIVGSSWSGGAHDRPRPRTHPQTHLHPWRTVQCQGAGASQEAEDEPEREEEHLLCCDDQRGLPGPPSRSLLRMGLKEQQEREIIHVLMDCCLQEKTFNPFYAVLGEKFCSHDRRFQMTFQFCLWDKFKELTVLPSSVFSNLVQLVTRFLLRKEPLSLHPQGDNRSMSYLYR
ncbi:hypothetical protein CRUP_019294 [Coryphaenoides rupestris]|nr:hypothetical protein CRUP_019294 [Coryphaenoides rupestris]